MSERKGIDLGDYVQVKDRIALFYELFGQGRLVTEEVRATTEPDDKPRIWVKAAAYRTPDDPKPGIGWSWMELPGATSFTRGSELENVETSAWGRAIGSLGILIDKSIATQNEIDNKAEPEPEKVTPPPVETEHLLGEISRTGKIAKGDGHGNDLEWRETPDGYHIGFRLEISGEKNIPQVWAEGPLGLTLFAASGMDADRLKGERAKCTGLLYEIKYPGRRSYHRLKLTKIEVLDVIIPPFHDAPGPLGAVPALSPEDQAEIDALVIPEGATVYIDPPSAELGL